MSEDDRMDRAERIREMREGRRVEGPPGGAPDDAAPSTEGDSPPDGQVEESTDADAGGAADGGESPADGAEQAEGAASADGGASSNAGDALAEVDEAVAAAVERVSGASASVPDSEALDDEAAAESAPAPADGPTEAGAGQVAESGEDAVAGGAEAPAPESAAEVGAAARAGMAAAAGSSEPETRVLEFTLDEEQYCLDIEYVEEIVKREGITRVPNTPAFVQGVVDLRGQITTILNPKEIIETEGRTPGDLLVVFDSEEFDEQGHIGWVVDDVRQVSPVAEEDVNEPPVKDDHVQGVIDRGDDEEFVVWTSPELALETAS